jgi:hypothetical protein
MATDIGLRSSVEILRSTGLAEFPGRWPRDTLDRRATVLAEPTALNSSAR